MKRPNLKCNIMFQKENEYNIQDTRFTKVKIWLMHLGINHNGSSFSRKAVEDAIPTLANTPILGYVEETEENKDFSDHRMKIEYTDDNEKKYIYQGQAYGVIPETNNAHFQKRLCDDGIEREFLVVDGLLWNKISDSIDILNRDLWKSQSMELADNEGDYEGEYDENFIYHFKKFKFYGACFLGNKYEPAMENATIELAFAKVNDNIKKQLKIFNKFIREKGGIVLDKEKNKKLTQCEEENDRQDDIEGVSTTIATNNVDIVKDNKEDNKQKDEESKTTNFDTLKYHIELQEKDKKIQDLEFELDRVNKDKEKISKEYADYKNFVELKQKKEMLEDYLDMLEDEAEYRALRGENGEEILKGMSLEDLKKELDSLIGNKVRKQHSRYSQKIVEESNKDATRHYFENTDNHIDFYSGSYGNILDDLS